MYESVDEDVTGNMPWDIMYLDKGWCYISYGIIKCGILSG